jgi:hypothetical protein
MNQPASPTRAQGLWTIAGVIPFLLSIALLGYALTKQVLVLFAVGWLVLQVFGYFMTLKMAEGDPSHHLVKAQVLLHWIALMLLVAMLMKAS